MSLAFPWSLSSVQRLGLNLHSYQGERIDIDRVLAQIARHAHSSGWESISVEARPGVRLEFYYRPAAPSPASATPPRSAYISAGIHGDEPAGPLAMLTLLRENQWPGNFDLWICPCLNPTGFRQNTRESDQNIDLNRDYRHRTAPEVQAHLSWMESVPSFELALCLHEDWESNGFYCYELNPDGKPSCAEAILEAVSPLCPIETASVIDGREADGSGIMRPNIDPAIREQWPEAFYLLLHKTRLSYTVETPSDFHLPTRVAALVESVKAALRCQARGL
jgi:protein MpaA